MIDNEFGLGRERQWFMAWIDKLIVNNARLKKEIAALKGQNSEQREKWAVTTRHGAVKGPYFVGPDAEAGARRYLKKVEDGQLWRITETWADMTEHLYTEIPGDAELVSVELPTYEYQVVCPDGVVRYFVGKIVTEAQANSMRRDANKSCTGMQMPHCHTVERRVIGSWEAT